jgi:hypothetical protein
MAPRVGGDRLGKKAEVYNTLMRASVANSIVTDVGQTGANIVTTGTAASAIAAPSLHGINVGTGIYDSQQKQ